MNPLKLRNILAKDRRDFEHIFPPKDNTHDSEAVIAQFQDLKELGGFALNAMNASHADYFVACKESVNDPEFLIIGTKTMYFTSRLID
jgi:hypothetical protein